MAGDETLYHDLERSLSRFVVICAHCSEQYVNGDEHVCVPVRQRRRRRSYKRKAEKDGT